MKTDDLIRALTADTTAQALPPRRAWLAAGGAAVLIAAAVFTITLGPRPDIEAAAWTARFLFKLAVTLALVLAAFRVLIALARPGAATANRLAWLVAVPVALAAAVVAELVALPTELWEPRLIGTNALVCLTYIPLIGIGPLVAFLLALRNGAPTSPARAGAVAGLLAGGVAAAFYALHCPDDSPLFVATWYTIAIAALTALGALAAPRIARW
jgi:hypothetical protein